MEKQYKKQRRKLVVTLSLLLIVGFLATSLVSYFVSRASLRSQIESTGLPLTSDNIYTEIKKELLCPIYISSFMANDTFLKEWIKNGEKDVSKITEYLVQIKRKYNTFTSFLVSENTRIYYQAHGILKKVDPKEERDVWYFRVSKMKPIYEMNFDPDMANNDTMTVFINYKIFDEDGKFLGATGIGLANRSISEKMEEFSHKYGRNIYLVNPDGKVLLHNLSFPIEINDIHEFAGLELIADNLLNTAKNSLKYIHNKKIIHLNTRYIPELNLYLFVEQTESGILENLNYTLLLSLIICALITAFVVSLTLISVKNYQKITLKQQEEISYKNDELQQKNSELESAVIEKTEALDKNILLMREMNHRVKNNLATIQSLLRIQSQETMDETSRLVLIESESRLKSITHLHQMLSKNLDLSKVNVANYIRNLVNDITKTFDIDNSKIKIEMEIQEIDLDMNILIPFALILNELLTNAFKYAFEETGEGFLQIKFSNLGDKQVELSVEDNGKGLPSDFDPQQMDSLGTTIIRLLVQQIKGELNYKSSPGKGTIFTVKFKK
jgi:two-component sensor histidine kinase